MYIQEVAAVWNSPNANNQIPPVTFALWAYLELLLILTLHMDIHHTLTPSLFLDPWHSRSSMPQQTDKQTNTYINKPCCASWLAAGSYALDPTRLQQLFWATNNSRCQIGRDGDFVGGEYTSLKGKHFTIGSLPGDPLPYCLSMTPNKVDQQVSKNMPFAFATSCSLGLHKHIAQK